MSFPCPSPRLLATVALLSAGFSGGTLAGQTPAESPAPATDKKNGQPDKRIFGVLPNYRTANDTGVYKPLTPAQKFTIAREDSFDWPVVFLSGVFAGLSQLDNSHPSFGQGVEGYARRLGTSYGDQAIGNLMTEGLFPILLHEDPRYFRRGKGTAWSRFGYAATRILVTRTDAGGRRFNFSEFAGNATAASIANAYYPGERKLSDNFQRLGTSLATDAVSNVLKEFWPDIKRKISKRSQPGE